MRRFVIAYVALAAALFCLAAVGPRIEITGRNNGNGVGPFVFVQNATNGISVATNVATVVLPSVTAGSLVGIYVRHEDNPTTLVVTNDLGTVLTSTTNQHDTVDSMHSQFFYVLSETAGTRTYTLSLASPMAWVGIVAMEFSYTGTAVKDIETAGNTNNTSTPTSLAFTTTGNRELVLAGCVHNATVDLDTYTVNGVAAAGNRTVDLPKTFLWYRMPTATFTSGTAAAHTVDSGNVHWLVTTVAFKTQ